MGSKWAAMDVGGDVGNELRQEVEILHQLCYSIFQVVVVVIVGDACCASEIRMWMMYCCWKRRQ